MSQQLQHGQCSGKHRIFGLLGILIIVPMCLVLVQHDFVCAVTSSSYNRSPNRNPYDVLNVSPSSSKKDIKQKYYQLCLKYHPDKIPTHISNQQRDTYLRRFKEIQWAYNEIVSSPTSSHSSNYFKSCSSFHSSNDRDPSDALKQFFMHFHGRSVHTFHSNYNHNINNMFPFASSSFQNNHNLHTTATSPLSAPKFIFQQKVIIPLSDLYQGIDQYHFPLVQDNILSRTCAAFRGGIINPFTIYQAILYSLPLLRISKYCSIFMFIFMVYQQVQVAATLCTTSIAESALVATLPPGYKGKTKIIFTSKLLQNDVTEIHYVIQEGCNCIYRRIPNTNDLQVSCTITPKQARNGCIIKLPSIRNTNDNLYTVTHNKKKVEQYQQSDNIDNNSNNDDPLYITVPVPPNTISNDIIRVKCKGWPIRRKRKKQQHLHHQQKQQSDYGDLVCEIQIHRHPMYQFDKYGRSKTVTALRTALSWWKIIVSYITS